MSVMLTNIDKLKTDSGKIKTYVDSYQSETGTMNRRFSEKIAGSESEALNKFIEIMNDYSKTVFSVHPGNVRELARAIEDYHDRLKELGFTTKLMTTDAQLESYKNAVNNVQIDRLSDPAIELQGLIDSENLVPGCTLKDVQVRDYIEKMLESMKQNSSLHDNVMSAKESFVTRVNNAKTKLDEDKRKIEQLKILTGDGGIMASDVISMVQNGVTADMLEAMLNNIEKTDDAAAIKHFANGDYDALFALDPNDISDNVYAVMINGMLEMFEIPKEGEVPASATELETMLNSLLQISEDKMEAFLLKLTSQNMFMGTQYAGILTLSPEELEKLQVDQPMLRNKLDKLNCLSALFDTMYILDLNNQEYTTDVASGASVKQQKSFVISKLRMSVGKDFLFELEETTKTYLRGVPDSTKIMEVSSNVNEGYVGQSIAEYGTKIKELNDAKAKAVQDLITGSLTQAMGAFIPGFSEGLGVINLLVYGISSKEGISGVEAIAKKGVNKGVGEKLLNLDPKSKKYKDFSKSSNQAVSAAGSILGLSQKLNEIDKEIDENQRKIYSALFNVGGVSTSVDNEYIASNSGIPNPETLKRVEYLNENGLGSILEDIANPEAFESRTSSKRKMSPEEKYFYYGGKIENINMSNFMIVVNNELNELGISYETPEGQLRVQELLKGIK